MSEQASQPGPVRQDGEAPRRTVVVLAAGLGKRMKSAKPKMLHEILGRSLVGHVLAAAEPLAAARTLVVVGAAADQVRAHLAEVAPAAEPVYQAEQRGTGHATRVALAEAPDVSGTVVVLTGDTPLLRPDTLAELVRVHEEADNAATVLTAAPADVSGLGRIIRDEQGHVTAIVEERDASPEQRAIREINSGIIAFRAADLRATLAELTADNDQGEEYLTDTIGLLVKAGRRVGGYVAVDATETLGCNDRAQLAQLAALLRDRVNGAWMRSGVTMVDPATTWVDVTVTVGVDAVIEPHVQLRGATTVGSGATVGPDTTLVDTEVGAGASVVRAQAQSAVVGPECSVGPFAYLRPGTRLHRKAKIGTYVETKNAEIGAGSKVPHLSYVGDATIGEQTNIGAATVFVNYDGVRKQHSTIGSFARTGADNMFVAPVQVGDGAYTGAGAVIRRDVPPGALSYSGGPQKVVERWTLTRRAGTPAADAAAAALGEPAAGATNDTPGVAAGGTAGDPGETAARPSDASGQPGSWTATGIEDPVPGTGSGTSA
ncbi:bifunctional UDP-N-acetylglucosamine diphosphorylase/glucosamine-1-phosphate N-acetyltransferase GlmU [Actinocatenispora rupis]|uniref:Bifunctional protein GlmU n=1 Tax=Actinocatenispora rupis TaxID=519421 RepID=A0A8J3NCD5_9ACTN|nr:bifunctional UDP-N-acetylglucosamine diphosphorylase/glucosamine-1-phosphate N-acetyltransferase GlmU [Actinocatenispora rupis]GID10319.1 bifunctional protein GlmU [Actinocatenispora rupis]